MTQALGPNVERRRGAPNLISERHTATYIWESSGVNWHVSVACAIPNTHAGTPVSESSEHSIGRSGFRTQGRVPEHPSCPIGWADSSLGQRLPNRRSQGLHDVTVFGGNPPRCCTD
jgi:hypothetical protein